jgi:HEAT repeat protein
MTPEQRREVTRAIVGRLAKEAAAPSDPKKQGAPGGSYVTQEVFELNQYTLALRNLKDPSAVEFLQEHLKNAGENARLRKWLVIALGFSGYTPVGSELKAILENDPDVSTRAIALRAYAAAVGPAAIPVLEAYTNDTTTLFPGGGGNPMRTKYPLRGVARDELVDLRKMAK